MTEGRLPREARLVLVRDWSPGERRRTSPAVMTGVAWQVQDLEGRPLGVGLFGSAEAAREWAMRAGVVLVGPTG